MSKATTLDPLLCGVCGIPFHNLSGDAYGCPVHGIQSAIHAKAAPDLLWYLREISEAVETLADRHGFGLPTCLPHALAAIDKAT